MRLIREVEDRNEKKIQDLVLRAVRRSKELFYLDVPCKDTLLTKGTYVLLETLLNSKSWCQRPFRRKKKNYGSSARLQCLLNTSVSQE